MNKILFNLGIIAVVAAVGVGATVAYFSDTETSVGNIITAGTIDISVDDANPWKGKATLNDMKPGYTNYIDFEIENTATGANPVNIYKTLKNIVETTGVVTESECTSQGATWDAGAKACDWNYPAPTKLDVNDLSSQIIYDLSVVVYQGEDETTPYWTETLYVDSDLKTIDAIYADDNDADSEAESVFLGMIPAGGHMKVKQSYHMNPDAGNAYQGDQMSFDIEIMAEQLKGTVVLEDKSGNPEWKILFGGKQGTLTYKVTNPTFNFTFAGQGLDDVSYVLAAGYDSGTNVDTVLGTGTASGGVLNMSGNVELGKDMKDVKVWLIPAADWSGSTTPGGIGTPIWGQMSSYLWETGLIWYEDTNN